MTGRVNRYNPNKHTGYIYNIVNGLTCMFKDSDVLYVCSVVECPILDIAKAHVVDDFCNEYVVTLNMHNNTVLKGYVKPDDLDVIDCIKYNRHDYDMLLGSASYEHSLNVI